MQPIGLGAEDGQKAVQWCVDNELWIPTEVDRDRLKNGDASSYNPPLHPHHNQLPFLIRLPLPEPQSEP